jgi:dTDP-4-amino-4,6-dideoxygalactose transaminase
VTDSRPTPYGRQSISPEDVKAVAQQLVSDWLTTGPSVESFERDLSYVTGEHPVVAVSSGTAALHCAYAALALNEGDEIITSPITFVSTAATAIKEGARVIFADVDELTGNLDAQSVQDVVSPKTRAIVAIDYAGNPADYREIQQVASDTRIPLIADASHSLGASLESRPVGDWADMTTLSFFPTKNIATGEGGAVVCKDQEYLAKVRGFRSHGLVRLPDKQELKGEGPWHQEVQEFGLNYRLTDIQAALGRSQLERLQHFLQRRLEIVDKYNTAFASNPSLRLPGVTPGARPAWHLYPLRVPADKRLRVYEELRKRSVLAQVNYLPVYWHPVFQKMGYTRGLCPNAEAFYKCEISLPLYVHLKDDEVDRIAQIVLESLR